jgi:hypothetical protein
MAVSSSSGASKPKTKSTALRAADIAAREQGRGLCRFDLTVRPGRLVSSNR